MDVSELTVFSRSIVRKYYSAFTCIHRNHRRGAFQWLKNYRGDKLTCSSNVKVSSSLIRQNVFHVLTYSCLFFFFSMIELLEPRQALYPLVTHVLPFYRSVQLSGRLKNCSNVSTLHSPLSVATIAHSSSRVTLFSIVSVILF